MYDHASFRVLFIIVNLIFATLYYLCNEVLSVHKDMKIRNIRTIGLF